MQSSFPSTSGVYMLYATEILDCDTPTVRFDQLQELASEILINLVSCSALTHSYDYLSGRGSSPMAAASGGL